MLPKIPTLFNPCLRHIYNLRWPDKIQNENLWDKSKWLTRFYRRIGARLNTPSRNQHQTPSLNYLEPAAQEKESKASQQMGARH
jgi:hypothetical protein